MANNLDVFVPEIWSRRIAQKLYQTNVAMNVMANTDYEGEVKEAGDTVHVRTYGRVTMQTYVRGQELTREDLTPTKEVMTVNEAKAFLIGVDALDVAQNDLTAMDGYTNEARISMDETIDTKIFSYVTDANTSNVLNSGSAIDITASSAGTTHIYDILVEAGRLLDEQNVPQEGRWAIVSPYFKALAMKDTVYFIKGSKLGDSIVQSGRFDKDGNGTPASRAPGFIGQMANFDLYVSTNLKRSSSNRYCPFGQGRPVSYAAQLRKLVAFEAPYTFETMVKGLLLHDGKVFTEAAKRFGYFLVDNA